MDIDRYSWSDLRGTRFGLLSKIAEPSFYGISRRLDGSVHLADIFDSYVHNGSSRLQATFDMRRALSALQQDLFIDRHGRYAKATDLGRAMLDAYVDELRGV